MIESIESQSDFANASEYGVLGLARNKDFHLSATANNNDEGRLLVQSLFENGVTDTNSYSFELHKPGEQVGHFDIGPPQVDRYRNDATTWEIQFLKNDFFFG